MTKFVMPYKTTTVNLFDAEIESVLLALTIFAHNMLQPTNPFKAGISENINWTSEAWSIPGLNRDINLKQSYPLW